jgi:hypothetical protein
MIARVLRQRYQKGVCWRIKAQFGVIFAREFRQPPVDPGAFSAGNMINVVSVEVFRIIIF